MKIIKKIGNAVYTLLLAVLVVLVLGTTFSLVEAPGGFRVFIVQSGSMEPEIKTGALAITRAESEYKAGEVVTFLAKPRTKMAENGSTVMHRIIEVDEKDGARAYTTKGDANQGNDPDPVLREQVLGKLLFALPYAGYGVAFARTKLGFLLLIVLPAAVVVGMELLTIKREAGRIWANRKAGKSGTNKKKAAKVLALMLAVLGLTSLVAAGSEALLSDEEKATGITISTGRWGEGPPLVCEFRGHKYMFHFGINNHGQQFNSFSYRLTYTADGVADVVIGESQALGDSFEQDIFLGTCLDEDCVTDDNFDDLELEVTLDGSAQRQMRCRFRFRENQWNEVGGEANFSDS